MTGSATGSGGRPFMGRSTRPRSRGPGPTLVDVNTPGPSSRLPRLTAVPAARSRAAVLKVRFYVLLGGLFSVAAIGMFSAFAWLTYNPAIPDPTAATPQGQALATIVTEAFLAGEALPVPAAANIALTVGPPVEVHGPVVWDRFYSFSLAAARMESHRFLFNRRIPDQGGQPAYELMELTVLIAIPADGNPVLAAQPQFAPASWVSSGVVTDYSDIDSPPLPATGRDQIKAWSLAWAAADAEKLKLLTGDPTPGVRYVGLGGYTAEDVIVVSALLAGEDSYLVRVRLVLKGANESTLEMDMDLTVKSASSGLPNIVGWGPAGSGVLTPADVRVSAE